MSAQRAGQLVEAGVWLQATGDHEGAKRLFEQALKLDPDNARARQLLGLKASPGAPPPPTPPPSLSEPPVSSGTLLFASVPQPSSGTLLYDPRAATPKPTAFDPPKPLPPPVEIDWGEATGAPPEAVQPEWEFRTPLTPPAPPKPIRADATSAWDSGTDPGVLVAPEPARPRYKDPLDLVTDGIQTPLPMKMPTQAQIDRLKEEVRTLLRGAKDLQELDDHSGAIDLLAKALDLDPLNKEALDARDRSERTLLAIYESKLGPMEAMPTVLLKQDEIIWLNLDHRAGFVLAQIDGTVTYDDLFAICGMSRLDTARILAQLVEERVIRS